MPAVYQWTNSTPLGLINDELDSLFDGDGTVLIKDLTPQLGGNLDVNGFTVDGRDPSVDGTKLDGIEALADVTDFTNVDAALNGNVITNFESVGIDDDATSTAVTIDSSERVGIGVAPDTLLTIFQAPSGIVDIFHIKATYAALGDGNAILFGDSGTDYIRIYDIVEAGGQVGMGISTADGSERIRVSHFGNVGINEILPAAILDIDGTIKMTERAAAIGDTAGKGQLWVKNTSPCELWFTRDDGTELQLS